MFAIWRYPQEKVKAPTPYLQRFEECPAQHLSKPPAYSVGGAIYFLSALHTGEPAKPPGLRSGPPPSSPIVANRAQRFQVDVKKTSDPLALHDLHGERRVLSVDHLRRRGLRHVQGQSVEIHIRLTQRHEALEATKPTNPSNPKI